LAIILAAAGAKRSALLDERKVKFEAIASANDEMAIGAMNALRDAAELPEDVACGI